MKAKKQFGQNFLIDKIVLDKISNTIFASNKDLIIEVGPGRGALTKKLLEKDCNLLAYEIDKDLIPLLNSMNNKNLVVKNIDFLSTDINADIKNYDYENLYIVGNLPYYITTPIIEHIILSKVKSKKITIMVQLEVAKRFAAKPKTKDYGYFTIYLQHFYHIEFITEVKPESFNPAPKVTSAVISLTPKENVLNVDSNFFDFIKECFKEKRKTIRNNLKNYDILFIDSVLKKLDISNSVRAEELTEKDLYNIYQEIILGK